MNNINAKRTEPLIPVCHPAFVWTTGADVQATWRRFGWTPPTEAKQDDEKSLATLHNADI